MYSVPRVQEPHNGPRRPLTPICLPQPDEKRYYVARAMLKVTAHMCGGAALCQKHGFVAQSKLKGLRGLNDMN
jgi:hypothetical protein